MSGTQVSSFYPVNQLLQDNAQQITNYYAPRKNELLLQKTQQEVSSNEMEVAARLAQGLLALPDEAAMAAAYPNAVAYGQGLGFLKNAPSVFPGVDRLRQIASYGVPAEKQYEQQGVRSAADAIRAGLSGGAAPGGGTTAAPGGGAATVATPGPIEGDAQARAFAVRDGLIKRGIDPDTATAFAANALHESSARPDTGPGDRGSSHGLFQWRADRFDRYQKIMGNVPDNAPLDQQLDYVVHELNTTEGAARDRIAAAQGPAAKAAAISQYYLRPKDVQAEMARRSATATQLAGALPNVTPGMTDQAWLDQMAKQYPSLGGPNANPNQPNLGTQPQPYQTASLTPTPPPSGATPAAPAQPAATTTAQGTAPAQQPPAAPAAALPAPPPPVGADGLNAQQRQTVNGMLSTARTPAQLQQVQAQIQTYRDHNETVQRQYQADVRQAQKDAEAAATAQQTAADRAGAAQRDQRRLELSEQANQRAEQEAAEKARLAGETYVPGTGIEAVHENTVQRLADKMRRGEKLTEKEQSLYDGAYYALQQTGGQTGTMSGPDGSTIPFQTTRRLPPTFPEPSGGALPAVISQPTAAKQEGMNTEQGKAAGFADRLIAATPVISDTSPAAMSRWEQLLGRVPLAGNSLVSEDFQRHMRAERDFINAVLRRESGASIQPSEFESARLQYIPQPGDGPKVLEDKAKARETALNNLIRDAGPTYKRPAEAGSGASTAAPPLEQRRVGAVYQTPKGPMKWTGTGWLPAGE